MFEESVYYSEEIIEKSIEYINSFSANLGGT